jgi:hypothetical protein
MSRDAATVPREQYERVVAALDQAVETLGIATDALAEDKLPQRAILTDKLARATRELLVSVGIAVEGGNRGA